MNLRLWIRISLGLNVALAACVLLALSARRPPVQGPAAAEHFANRIVRVRQAVPATTNLSVITVTAPFHWSEVESADYRVYVANLRAIGCPEATVRDIVEADVNALFAGRVRVLVEGVTGRYWELIAKYDALKKLIDDKQAELMAMGREKAEMLEALLDEDGGAAKAKEAEAKADALADWKSKLDFLTDDQVERIRDAWDGQSAAVDALDHSDPALSVEEKRQKVGQLEAKRERMIEALLTPEEAEEYKLRTGASADFRFRFGDIDLTETEARAVTVAGSGPEFGAQLKQLLGPDRYAEFQRVQDYNYQQVRSITDRFDLPGEAAARVFEIQEAIVEQAKSIRKDSERTAEERRAILEALRAEGERSIGAALGPAGYKTYLKYNQRWVSRFAGERE